MGSTHTEVSGGGCSASIADLPSDWRQLLEEEMRDASDDAVDESGIVRIELLVKNGIVYNRGGWRIGKLGESSGNRKP